MLADFHIHTCFSGDSEADVDKIIESAIEKGMRYMAITDTMTLNLKMAHLN